MNARQAQKARTKLVGIFGLLCFVLQQFFVPVHLALNDHVLSSGSNGHLHTQTTDPHVHEKNAHVHEDEGQTLESVTLEVPGDNHEPHPAEDHLAELIEPAVLPSLVHVPIAPELRAPKLPPLWPSRRLILADAAKTERPPIQSAAAPRAPPSIT